MWLPLYSPVADPDFPDSFKKRPSGFPRSPQASDMMIMADVHHIGAALNRHPRPTKEAIERRGYSVRQWKWQRAAGS